MGDSRIEPNVIFDFNRTISAAGEPVFTVAENGVPFLSATDPQFVGDALESKVHLEFAARTAEAVFVHAGVVAWRGKAIVIPGPSNTGKSTLVAALVAAGATYYSDEYAVFNLEGRIHGFPRRLRLRPDVACHERFGSANVAHNGHLPSPVPLGWVLNVPYRTPASRNRRLLTPGQTLLALLANTVAVRRQAELTVRTLKLAVGSATGLHFERGDAETAAQGIIRFIEEQFHRIQIKEKGII